jgi:hypothetical protein
VSRDDLADQLADVEARLRAQPELRARARDLDARIAAADRDLAQARARLSLPLLNAVTVSSPCHQPWETMTGDDRVRHCGQCDKDVFDLSALTAAQAEALLRERLDGGVCVQLYRRPAGTVMTSDCPTGARRRGRRRLVAAVAIAAGVLGGTAATAWTLVDRAPATGEPCALPAPPPETVAPPVEDTASPAEVATPPPAKPTHVIRTRGMAVRRPLVVEPE